MDIWTNANIYPNADHQNKTEKQCVDNAEKIRFLYNQISRILNGLIFISLCQQKHILFLLQEMVASEIEAIKNHQVFGSSYLIYFPHILGIYRRDKRPQLTSQVGGSITSGKRNDWLLWKCQCYEEVRGYVGQEKCSCFR